MFTSLLFAAAAFGSASALYLPDTESRAEAMLSQYAPYTHFAAPSGYKAQGYGSGPSSAHLPKPSGQWNPSGHWSHPGGAWPTSTHAPSGLWQPSASSSALPTHSTAPSNGQCAYWLDDIKHQGVAAFNPDPTNYQVYRNVKDFGAQGDGVTDDAAAINAAISSGNRCAPGACNSTTTTPAVVYFPPGTYMVNSSIIDYYYTQLIGNPNCLPTIRALSTFSGGLGVIDGDAYQANGQLGFGATNVFWRQIRNFIIDLTLVPSTSAVTGIHWPTGQATSISNVIFEMSQANGTQHQGVFIEQGSGGFLNDLTFNGGLYGATLGNQQFTMRNFTFNNVVTAINQNWDWGWTYYGLHINNCSYGINMTNVNAAGQTVGSIVFFDSSITDTPVGVWTAWSANAQPPTAGSLILENLDLDNVPVAVLGAGNVVALAGCTGTCHIGAWGEGHAYAPNGPSEFQGEITPAGNPRPAVLQGSDGRYYQRSKPQYEGVSLSGFLSARDAGARGDGHTDDTTALQNAINQATQEGKILFVDHGDYLVSNTITIPAGARIVGESYSVILSTGNFFNDINNPKPVVSIGSPGEHGSVEWSDMIVSTKGQQRGAILFQYNLVAPAGTPTGLWDVHSRVGGFAGSDLQLADCPKTPDTLIDANNLAENCIATYLTFHITPQSSGLYLENVWLWVADHDVEDPNLTQITIYAGRGLLDQSAGPVWMVGTAVEHHVLYEYQFSGAQNVFAGQIQTETAYYQPNPAAPQPFPFNGALDDPTFPPGPTAINQTLSNDTIPDSDGWGLRIVKSHDILFYGVGLYSFFDNYNVHCSDQGNGEICQSRILSVDTASTGINVYNLNTVGTHYMITRGDQNIAFYADNLDGFVDTIALFRTEGVDLPLITAVARPMVQSAWGTAEQAAEDLL